jgi:hypothetical protein
MRKEATRLKTISYFLPILSFNSTKKFEYLENFVKSIVTTYDSLTPLYKSVFLLHILLTQVK